MFFPHPNNKLQKLFSIKPYQGADPATARFLFVGLDANYDPAIAEKHYFPEVVSYLEDGAHYWRLNGFHHPFLHPDYAGDGKLYHQRFSKIGFTPDHAEMVSFVELIDVPTFGRSSLMPQDLKASHLDRLREWVMGGNASYIFLPPGVARLLRNTPQFSGLSKSEVARRGGLPVLFKTEKKTIFSPYHFSFYGKHYTKEIRDLQIDTIRSLIP